MSMCPEAGEDVPSGRKRFCKSCGRELSPDSRFCPRCGQDQNGPMTPPPAPSAPAYYAPYVPPKTFGIRDLGRGIGSWSALALLILTAVNVVILLWGMGLVYPHLDMHVTLYVIVPFIVPIYELGGGISFFLYYAFLAVAITASFLWMMKKSVRPAADELAFKEPKGGHSPLYVIATVFMAVISFNIIFNLMVTTGGATPSTPDFNSREVWTLLYSFAHASVWEELISRVLLIGIPLLIVDYVISSGKADRGMKKWHRYFLGGGFSIGRKEAFFLAFSSTMFGLAHVFSWDFYKVIPAIVGGLAFGYLFLKLGLYASIMLHFMLDYLSIPLSVFPDSTGLTLTIGLLMIAWIFIGIPYLIRYAARGIGWIIGRKVWPDAPMQAPQPVQAYPPQQYPPYQQAPPYQPQAPSHPQGYQQWQPPAAQAPPVPPQQPQRPRDPTAIGYICPHCGNTEATYENGELKCTKCGKS
ncbi:CPBP family glutamic-type intramembrane protease [Methanomassiliicoccus luminyensis]|uniref:CPBP family glutamic-type intramembrane protease n=1 Tax=Methanomassiliicoccus luminyensis TaxID=1080712 RepID=UPI0004747672|nr:CPBP family glutamic-type intramembrane protease [Methanomassiliicoccus luminyensis]